MSTEFSDADHGFFSDASPRYNSKAAAASWALALEFLKTYLG
ncbi:MAG: dienelactone hydrolase family protein [Terriglobia bacterium]